MMATERSNQTRKKVAVQNSAPFGALEFQHPRSAEDYITLASFVLAQVQKGKINDLEDALKSVAEADKLAHSAFAKALIENELEKVFDERLSREKERLWLQAVNGGLKDLIDNHHAAANADVAALLDQSEKLREKISERTSFGRQVSTGIIAALLFGILLIVTEQLDNPLSAVLNAIVNIQ